MTKTEYNKYKYVSNKVIDLLVSENSSSMHDIKIVYNIIMGFPYCIDCEGHYIYNGEYYGNLEDLPNDALTQLSK